MPRWCSCTSPTTPYYYSTTTTSTPNALSLTPQCNFYSPPHHGAPHHHTVEVVCSPKHHAGNAPEITALHQTHNYTKHETSSEINIMHRKKHHLLPKLTTAYEHEHIALHACRPFFARFKARSKIKPEAWSENVKRRAPSTLESLKLSEEAATAHWEKHFSAWLCCAHCALWLCTLHLSTSSLCTLPQSWSWWWEKPTPCI